MKPPFNHSTSPWEVNLFLFVSELPYWFIMGLSVYYSNNVCGSLEITKVPHPTVHRIRLEGSLSRTLFLNSFLWNKYSVGSFVSILTPFKATFRLPSVIISNTVGRLWLRPVTPSQEDSLRPFVTPCPSLNRLSSSVPSTQSPPATIDTRKLEVTNSWREPL